MCSTIPQQLAHITVSMAKWGSDYFYLKMMMLSTFLLGQHDKLDSFHISPVEWSQTEIRSFTPY